MIYVFDIDGTLTPARQPMNTEFMLLFLDFCRANRVYLCTGSDWEKVLEQVPNVIVDTVEGIFTCSGNSLWVDREEKKQFRNDFKPSEKLLETLAKYIEDSKFPYRTGKHFEFRTGMMNFSIVGRSCSKDQRKEYHSWDEKNHERKIIASELRAKFPSLDFNIGGEISIDIHPKGYDKSRAIKIIKQLNEGATLHFFGDKMHPGGNDYPVLKEIGENDDYSHVEDWQETRDILSKLMNVDTNIEKLKPKPSIRLAPRGIETFTVCRRKDETGVSGTGVVIEGVEFATGQVVLHWLTPFPKGSVSIFDSFEDFKRVHILPHPTNKTIITWSDGRQEEY
jgi:phosphomannomutase